MALVPVRMRRLLVEGGKELLVRSNRNAPMRFAGRRAYDVMQAVIRQRFGSVRGVKAVYLCHSLALGECYPGLSDFDLAVVFDDPEPLEFYGRIRQTWGSLKRYLPISDLSILSIAEFEEWQMRGGGWDPLDEVRHWKLIAGKELRHDVFDQSGSAAALDRMQWALGHFHNLLGVGIKEEPQSALMAVIARRQLHKCFWNTVLALDSKYLAASSHGERVALWIEDFGTPYPVSELQQMYSDQFTSGPVTVLRFAAASLAYRLVSESLSQNPLLARPLYRPHDNGFAIPIANESEVLERMTAMCASVREMIEEKLECVMLGSTGTVRGYSIYIILRDGLSDVEIAGALRDIRAIHRVFDDPWFNEHFPAGIPTVCSRTMFLARLQSGRSSLHYFEKFRRVLFGADLYEEAISADAEIVIGPTDRLEDWAREHLLYSLHLHQVYLARLKPALHDYVTFYYPRMLLQRVQGSVPATAEEAVVALAGLPDGVESLPGQMLDAYRGKDLDALLKTMDWDAFTEAWPMLRKGLHPATR